MQPDEFKISTIEDQLIDYFNKSEIITDFTFFCNTSKINKPAPKVFSRSLIENNQDLELALKYLLDQEFIKIVDETQETISYINNKLESTNQEQIYEYIEDFMDENMEKVIDYLQFKKYSIQKINEIEEDQEDLNTKLI